MILSDGDVVHGYEVTRLLGTGAFSEVHAVRELSSGSEFALKVLTDPSLWRSTRFSRELGILSSLQHRNVIRSHGYFVVRGHPAMLLELVPGVDLQWWLHDEAWIAGRELKLHLLEGMLRGVAAAHALGVVHRDLKPANILVMTWGSTLRAKVADFGLARLLSGEALNAHVTSTGVAMGTIGFMAPEQFVSARRAGPRADIWSLGCIAYELFGGAPAFPGDVLLDVMNACRNQCFTPLRELNPDLPDQLCTAIEACLDPEPAARPSCCGELALALGLELDLPSPLVVEEPGVAGTPTPPRPAALRTLDPDDWAD